jgi:hypothetical protein
MEAPQSQKTPDLVGGPSQLIIAAPFRRNTVIVRALAEGVNRREARTRRKSQRYQPGPAKNGRRGANFYNLKIPLGFGSGASACRPLAAPGDFPAMPTLPPI